MKHKIGVKIMPREVILDTQGRAIQQTLKLNNLPTENVRVGRYVELELGGDEKAALVEAEKITKFVLYNPLIETYEIKKV